MAEITKNHVFTALGVVAVLGFGYFKFQERSSRIYSEANDPIVWVQEDGPWSFSVHNTGPATKAVSFWWSDTKPNSVYCLSETYFSSDERRSVTNVCPANATDLPPTAMYYPVILTLDQYERSNWREVFQREVRNLTN